MKYDPHSIELWQELTTGLGVYGETAFLTAIADEGYKQLGRGAVCLDLTPIAPHLVCYANLEKLSDMLTGSGQAESVETLRAYNPVGYFITLILQDPDPPGDYRTTCFLLERTTFGSIDAQNLARLVHAQGLSKGTKPSEIHAHFSFEMN